MHLYQAHNYLPPALRIEEIVGSIMAQDKVFMIAGNPSGNSVAQDLPPNQGFN